MLYNLVLVRNKPYSNTLMAHLPEEVGKEWGKVFSDENHAKYGVKWVVYCDCAWCSEDYSVFAVNSYKDIPARLAHWKEIENSAWYQYADLFTLLGTSDNEPQMPDFPNPIYQLFIIRNDPATAVNLASESKDEAAARDAKWQESLKRTGACLVIYCNSYWAMEDYLGFGVIAFPSVEARQAHANDLLEIGWNKYTSAFTLLGIPRE